ncbi:hypothetical protein M3Y97_00510900 [Aphelenchoides bicaudatus]|nr:hypothetical protein M3Y97_00510900 [Aphelenchoides bicaudatus]
MFVGSRRQLEGTNARMLAWLSLSATLFLFVDQAMASDQLKLIQDLLESYDSKAKPTWDNNRPVNVTFSMDLYQLLELNEPMQYILLNAWIIERWHDEFLASFNYWNPLDYGNISEVRLPYHTIWMSNYLSIQPDTTLYNSLVMKDDDTRRLLNAKLTTNMTRKAVFIELLYPTIYKFSCLLNLRYFPFDVSLSITPSVYNDFQLVGHMIKKELTTCHIQILLGTSNFLENEGWYLFKTTVKREEVKYSCCPNKYTLLRLTLFLRRKPLFYLVNLIIPTSIITLIAIVGFFTTSSASGMREEKVSLGITTLLSMSILMLMVSDQMPTTSTFIPLIGWFILGMIVVISTGTLASSVVIAVQKRGRLGERLSLHAIRITKIFAFISITDTPLHLRPGTREYDEAPPPVEAYKKSIRIHKKLEHLPRKQELTASPQRKRNWYNVFHPTVKSANGIPSDKSIDPLIQDPSFRTRFYNILLANVACSPAAPFCGVVWRRCKNEDGLAQRLIGISNPVEHMQPTSMQINFDDMISQTGSDIDSKPATARSQRVNKSRMNEGIGAFNENIRLSRQLAQKEYEWLATVMERCFFIVFVLIFLLLTAGINLIGYFHWSDIQAVIRAHEEHHVNNG